MTQQVSADMIADVTGVTGAGGGLRSVQVFTSSGTWTKPAGVKLVKVTVVGGGGGGGGGAADGGGGGGGAGGIAIEIIDVSGTSSETVTIGALGTGGAAATNGVAGGTSSFGSFCSATGGGFGTGVGSSTSGDGGAGGAGSGGDVNITSDRGKMGSKSPSFTTGGFGGTSPFGGVGREGSQTNARAGLASTGYGAGGSGGSGNVGGTNVGQNGSPGIIIVEEYA